MAASTMVKVLSRPLLGVDHARDQDAGVGDDHAPRLQADRRGRDRPASRAPRARTRAARAARRCRCDRARRARRRCRGGGWRGRRRAGGRASSRISEKASRKGARSVIWLPMCMWMPATSRPGSLRRLGVEPRRIVERHAELVLRLAGGDLGVRLGIDVGVDAQGDAGGAAEARRHLAQRLELGLRLHVEAENALAERISHLGARLADAGEDDPVRRHAGRPRAAQLAFGHDVHAGAELGQASRSRPGWSWP